MRLLEGEQLFMPNCRNGSQFVQVVGEVVQPDAYLQHILRVASNLCHMEPHRLWPLLGGCLRLLPEQIRRLNKHINTQYSGRVQLSNNVDKRDVFWAGLATHICKRKISIGSYCRKSSNGKHCVIDWLPQSRAHAVHLGFMAATDCVQCDNVTHNIPETGLEMPPKWWQLPKWLENTDGLLQHMDYMQPLVTLLQKGHQCAYCVQQVELMKRRGGA